eukprot:jgi/Tetstr1/452920/TSEL_039956.t1
MDRRPWGKSRVEAPIAGVLDLDAAFDPDVDERGEMADLLRIGCGPAADIEMVPCGDAGDQRERIDGITTSLDWRRENTRGDQKKKTPGDGGQSKT